jgi:hypothetical protein
MNTDGNLDAIEREPVDNILRRSYKNHRSNQQRNTQ